MKKFIYSVIVMSLLVIGMANATTISFVSPLSGVDDTSGFSAGDSSVDVGTNHLNLLGGTGDVNTNSPHLTHRLTRGLGVKGGEDDEVDSYGTQEKIIITFDTPKSLSSFEVRSLFNEETGIEQGDVDMFLGVTLVHNEHLVGSQLTGTDGVLAVTYGSPFVVDKLVFYVQQDQSYTSHSEFAVAKLVVDDVQQHNDVPEFTTVGAGLVLAGAGLYMSRKRK